MQVKRRLAYKLLLVVTEVARQQLWMYQNNKQSIEDRIVSLTQPFTFASCPLQECLISI